MKNKKLGMLLLAIVLCISCFLTCFDKNIGVAFASSVSLDSYNSYSSVMEDLQKDKDFNANNYVSNENDYTLDVIQIAESSTGELFVYVYQPSGSFRNLVATSINISKTIYENLHYVNYTLTLLNSYSVFYKYKVDNFEILGDLVRYYEISSIMREYIEGVDKKLNNDNTISEIGIEVAKRFTASTSDNNVSYTNTGVEVVTITDKFNTTLRYSDGYWLAVWDKTDRHVVAFSTDWQIDKLFEVDMSFVTKDYTITNVAILPFDIWNIQVAKTYSNEQTHNITITSSQKTSNNANGVFGYKHEWNRIESASDFLNNNSDLSDKTIDNVKNKDWVLSFYETEWKKYDHMAVPTSWGVEVSDVVILRLKFETEGVVYNLGVVDSKQTASSLLGNIQTMDKYKEMIQVVLMLVLLVLVVVVVSPFLPSVIKILLSIVKFVFKIILWVVTAPIKLIGKVFKKRE